MCALAHPDVLISAHWNERHSIEITLFLNMFYAGEERDYVSNKITSCSVNTFELSVNIHCYFISCF